MSHVVLCGDVTAVLTNVGVKSEVVVDAAWAVGGRVIKFMATIHVPHLVQIYEYPLPDATEELARLPTAHSSADFHSGRVQCVARSGGGESGGCGARVECSAEKWLVERREWSLGGRGRELCIVCRAINAWWEG